MPDLLYARTVIPGSPPDPSPNVAQPAASDVWRVDRVSVTRGYFRGHVIGGEFDQELPDATCRVATWTHDAATGAWYRLAEHEIRHRGLVLAPGLFDFRLFVQVLGFDRAEGAQVFTLRAGVF